MRGRTRMEHNAHPTEDLACRRLVELVTDYLEDALSPHQRRRFEAHLDECPGCRAYLRQVRVTLRITGALTPATIAPPARDELLRAFRDWGRS